MIDKGIRYEDQKLTKKQKKKIKPANQGGGPNYLGKQKTVTVPKKWLSDPDHVVAELAYITPREKKILIDLDLYGSLKGKPNRGPAGIQSLQGDMGGFGGTGGGGAPGPGDTGGEGGNSPQDNSTSQFGGGSPSTGGDSGDTREQYSVTRTVTPKDKEVEVGPISEPERDTGLEKQRKLNEEILDKFKKTRPEINVPEWSILTKILEDPLQKFSDWSTAKNRDYFENVIRAGNIPGLNFSNLTNVEDLEKAYQDYMDARLSGEIDAMGRPRIDYNLDSNKDKRGVDTSGILETLIQPGIFPGEEPVILPTGFNYTPYSNQVVIAPGSQGLASLMGSDAFKSTIK